METEPTSIAALGIDLKTLLIQAVNFFILLFLLWKFAYKPILKMLNERTEKIDQSLKMAQENQKKAEQLENQIKEATEKNRQQAKAMLDESRQVAETIKKKIKEEAHQEADQLMKMAETRLKQQKEELKEELRRDMAKLVMAATEKLLPKTLDGKSQKELLRESIKEVEKVK